MSLSDPQLEAKRRAGIRRTALALGLVALSIYIAFVLSGVIGRVDV